MSTLAEVTEYIQENVLYSQLYDNATEPTRAKAFNQAVTMLKRYLPEKFTDAEPSADVIAEQVLWLLKLDDTFQRAELGVSSISIDGISINFTDMDRTIAPAIMDIYGIRTVRKRKIGSYSVPHGDTGRIWNSRVDYTAEQYNGYRT